MIFTPESRPIRESPTSKIQADPNEKLLPEVESYCRSNQVDAYYISRVLNGSYQPPAGCSCDKSIIDCQAHREEAPGIGSLTPDAIGTRTGTTIYNGPMPGLNKYGDIPNHETNKKAARRRANRELRGLDPERYAEEMEIKKAARDDYLRAQRAAGLS